MLFICLYFLSRYDEFKMYFKSEDKKKSELIDKKMELIMKK